MNAVDLEKAQWARVELQINDMPWQNYAIRCMYYPYRLTLSFEFYKWILRVSLGPHIEQRVPHNMKMYIAGF
jgi:hypothetical protein